ncbi:uncharacterized protein LOC143750610 isoform X2 [Siphateles boraxobius]|uniref:uncharacterized protein LOC143750610 isoform X2 n=1 Tax=Siphateles boraxobius TaxID=180520 RepID=UPI00406383FD
MLSNSIFQCRSEIVSGTCLISSSGLESHDVQIHLHHVFLPYAMASGSRPACSEPEKRRDVPAARSPDNTLYPPLKSLFTAPRRGNYSAAEVSRR